MGMRTLQSANSQNDCETILPSRPKEELSVLYFLHHKLFHDDSALKLARVEKKIHGNLMIKASKQMEVSMFAVCNILSSVKSRK